MEGEDRGADRRNKPSAIVKYRQVSLQNPPSWPIVDGPPLAPIYMMVLARGAYRGLDFEDMPPTIPTFRTHVTLTALLGFGKATRRVRLLTSMTSPSKPAIHHEPPLGVMRMSIGWVGMSTSGNASTRFPSKVSSEIDRLGRENGREWFARGGRGVKQSKQEHWDPVATRLCESFRVAAGGRMTEKQDSSRDDKVIEMHSLQVGEKFYREVMYLGLILCCRKPRAGNKPPSPATPKGKTGWMREQIKWPWSQPFRSPDSQNSAWRV